MFSKYLLQKSKFLTKIDDLRHKIDVSQSSGGVERTSAAQGKLFCILGVRWNSF